MTQSQLIKKTAAQLGRHYTKNGVGVVLNQLIANIGDALAKGDEVKIPKFGTFSVKELKGREVTHPVTREIYELPPQKTVKFKVTQAFKDSLNVNEEDE